RENTLRHPTHRAADLDSHPVSARCIPRVDLRIALEQIIRAVILVSQAARVYQLMHGDPLHDVGAGCPETLRSVDLRLARQEYKSFLDLAVSRDEKGPSVHDSSIERLRRGGSIVGEGDRGERRVDAYVSPVPLGRAAGG